ncbi:MAG: AI-2E family transporter, partial [Casimicrobiaceae bacterium]
MRTEVTRTTLAVLSIGILIAASFWIMRPFLVALIWATMIVVATWPVLLSLQRRLGGRRTPAIVAMTTGMLLVFALPFWIAISTLANYSDQVGPWSRSLQQVTIPLPPGFIDGIPMVGAKVAAAWREVASDGWSALMAKLQPYILRGLQWLAAEAGTVGILVIQFLLTIVITAVLYANGESAAAGVRRFGQRLAGARGEQSIRLAGQAIRGVALGVVVTALVQSLLGGLGLAVAGVPFAAALSVAMMMLCLAQVGPLVVLAGCVVTGFVIRPMLPDEIRRGGPLVALLIAALMFLVVIVVERLWTLRGAKGKESLATFAKKLQTAIQNNDLEGAIDLCRRQRG